MHYRNNSINKHNDCGCGSSPECVSILDIASPIEGQILKYSETFNAFINVMDEQVTPVAQTNGTGTPTGLGDKCPAVTPTVPYAWLTFELSDGSVVYMPAWK